MKPKIVFIVDPDKEGDYSNVTVSVSGVADDGKEHWIRVYEQLVIVQPLPDTMGVEIWTLAALGHITDYIRTALSSLVNGGSKTLMLDAHIVQKD